MPELPEVETIRRQLDKVLTGQTIKDLQGSTLKVIGRKVVAVKRKAKMIIIELSGGENLLIHLKMTGQLLINAQPGKHTRVTIQLTKDRLVFNDLRKFGWVKVATNQQLQELFAKLPPDVVDREFTANYMRKVLKSSGRAVKLVLLDQAKMGGIGNIYANEALYCAGIKPVKPANKIIGLEVRFLHKCIRRVIKAGIRAGGTTASDENFVNLFGRPGRFQTRLQVYEQKGEQCHQCRSVIQKIKLGGRGTYFCPMCQK